MGDRSKEDDRILRAIAAAPPKLPPLAAPAYARVKPGAVVAARFVVAAIVAEDGHKIVCRARDQESSDEVTLEIVRARWTSVERSRQEMAAIVALAHPRIARCLGYGSCADGTTFIALEGVAEATLAQRLLATPLSISDCVLIGRALAAAIGEAHRGRIVHGAITPSNVRLPNGALSDAQLSGFADTRLEPRRLTETFASSVVASYLSPEQIRGAADIDERADLFSLGCVLFECLTGEPPFYARTHAAALAKLLMNSSPAPSTLRSDLPPALDALVSSMMIADRAKRTIDAAAVLRELERFELAELSTTSPPRERRRPLAPAAAPFGEGALLLGRYCIQRELGRGGMGRVFAARDVRLDRDVAIKVLLGEPNHARALYRFEQEARAASRINHPNIATVYDVIATDDGPAIVSELLEGSTLREYLATHGPCTADDARALGVQLADGLAAAHEGGVVHRDLKPANLFLTSSGRLKILDFGLAKLLEPDSDAPATEEGIAVGTLGYMSPEQVRGGVIDARSDLFTAGIVLYELVAGRRPFDGDSRHEIESRIVQRAPAPLVAVPAALSAIVMRCLEKAPERRFQSARELTTALGSPDPPSASSVGPARRIVARRAVGYALVVATAVAIGIGWHAVARRSHGLRAPASQPSIAVMPFADLSPAHDQAYLSDGLAEEILTSLARVDGLQVAGRTSSFSFKSGAEDAKAIGQKLNVATLLEGSVRKSGQRVRISARLINADSGYQLWAQDFDRDMNDIAAVEDELAREVVGALRVRLVGPASAAPGTHGTRNAQAYDDYLLARRQDHEPPPSGPETARKSLERALALDPEFAAAWAQYALVLIQLGFTNIDRESSMRIFAQALDAAERAIKLDPNLPDGYVARSDLRGDVYWQLRDARADMEHALALSPNDATVLFLKGKQLLYFTDRVDEAIATLRRATEINPLDSGVWMYLAWGYRNARRFDEERAALTRSLQIAPQNELSTYFLGELEVHQGHPDRALTLFDSIGADGEAFRLVGQALAYTAMHRTAEARAAARKMEATVEQDGPAFAGRAFWEIGDGDKAFVYFNRSVDNHDVAMLDVVRSPFLDELHRDPRYAALLKRIELFDHPSDSEPMHGTRNAEAYEQYLSARKQAMDGSQASLETARQMAERALALDQNFAAAWALYARVLFGIIWGPADHQTMARLTSLAADAAERAIALDPTLSEGYRVRGDIRGSLLWQPRAALQDLERALSLSPDDPDALGAKGCLLVRFAPRVDEALAILQRVTTRHPARAGSWHWLAMAYRRAGRFTEERAALEKERALDPKDDQAKVYLAELDAHSGNLDRALALFDDVGYADDGHRILGHILVFQLQHRDREARAALHELVTKYHDESPSVVGYGYALMGQLDEALRYLNLGIDRHEVTVMNAHISPYLESLHRDPRYAALVKRMDLLDGP